MSCHSAMIGAEFTRGEISETAKQGHLLSMEIEFSLRCNYRCKYCYVGDPTHGMQELSGDESRDVILQAKELGARKIIILGGEPMIYPQIREMLAFIRGHGLDAEMFTNGTNMTPEMAKYLYDLGVQVVLKMNSFDETIQDELAGTKGAHKIIQAAFKNLRDAGFPSEGHFMAVSTIICSRNLPEIVTMWKWLRDQTIVPYFEIMTPQGNATRNDGLDVELPVLQKVFDQLSEIDRSRYGYEWDPQPPLVGSRCLRHQFSCLVNTFGFVMPCVGVTTPVGNIRERKLAEILHDSEIIQDLRCYEKTIRGPCGDCEKASICYGCRGAAYQLTGDYLASDPLCWRNLGKGGEILKLPAPVGDMIPQQGSMRVVDRIISVGERNAVVESTVRADSLFVDEDGLLDSAVYLEIIAQAAAAMHGFRTSHWEGQLKGFLIGARNMEVKARARAGDVLTVTVFKASRYGDFGVIEGKVLRGDELLASGEIKVWHDTAKPAAAAGAT